MVDNSEISAGDIHRTPSTCGAFSQLVAPFVPRRVRNHRRSGRPSRRGPSGCHLVITRPLANRLRDYRRSPHRRPVKPHRAFDPRHVGGLECAVTGWWPGTTASRLTQRGPPCSRWSGGACTGPTSTSAPIGASSSTRSWRCSYVYGVPAEDVRVAAEQRAAMDHSDRWVKEGCDPESPLMAAERAALVRSYAGLLAAVHLP